MELPERPIGVFSLGRNDFCPVTNQSIDIWDGDRDALPNLIENILPKLNERLFEAGQVTVANIVNLIGVNIEVVVG